jgi:hypothetical protein
MRKLLTIANALVREDKLWADRSLRKDENALDE